MKYPKLFSGVVAMVAVSLVSSQAQLTLNFSSTPGSTIQFNGTSSSFQFNSSTISGYAGTQWQIGSEVGGTGSAVGLFGVFNNGPFSYGPITTSGTIETASVTGPLAGLSIDDGAGYFLTGNIDWIQVDTYYNSVGSLAGQLMVNATGLSYSGSNPDLQTVTANGPGEVNLTFQFSPGKTLTQLTSGTGPYSTSFSGSLSVPEPSALTLALLGLVICGLGISYRRQAKPAVARSKRRNRI